MSAPLRCDRCADVIGVYEPLVVVEGGVPRETSQAKQPLAGREAEARYHLGCWLEVPDTGG